MGKTERNDLERYFEWYLDDLVRLGYVRGYDRESETFTLLPAYQAYRMKYHQKKEPTKELYNVLQSDSYTYDYRVFWDEKAKGIFYNESDWGDKNNPPVLLYKDTFFHAHYDMGENCFVSYVDVKPVAKAARYSGQLSSFATFPTKQKILLWNYGVYINKIVPIPSKGSGKTTSLFKNSFTPTRYFISDGGTTTRNIRYSPILTAEKYINKRKSMIGAIDKMVKSIMDKKDRQTKLL